MFIRNKIKYRLLILSLIFITETACSQFCDTTYFSIIYKDKGFINLSKSFVTSDGGVACLENNNYYPPGLIKFTSQGSVIWSAKYNAPFAANGNHAWTELSFKDAISVDTGFYVAGSVTKHGIFSDNTEIPPPKTAAVLMYVNKYGNVVWSRDFESAVTDTYVLTNIYKTKGADLIGYLAVDNKNISYGKILCLNPDGTIKWVIPLNTGSLHSGKISASIKRGIRQIADGNIVVADIIYDNSSSPVDAEFHYMSLNPVNGSINWETSFQYPTRDSFYVPRIDNLTELPNGNLSLQTSLDISTPNQPTPFKKQTNVITDKNGNLKKIIAYYPANGAAWNIDAINDNSDAGDQTILMRDETNKALLMRINKNGEINWVKKYWSLNNGLLPSCLSKSSKGYNVFLSRFITDVQLIRTDQLGNIDCDTTAVTMISEEASLPSGNIKIITNTNPANDNEAFTTGGFVTAANFDPPLQAAVECQKNIPCCIDIIDTTHIHKVSLCTGSKYILPDNTVVKDSGSYYAAYKTATGCDSIVYFDVKVYKNPADLHLVPDTCLHMKDSMVLRASDGYGSYVWMHNPPSPSPYFTVGKTGNYWVTVSNLCGLKTDTVHVYDKCDFTVYMPNAFTPNHDGINDVFRVPPPNKEQLVRLFIYNRWGELIFSTTDISKGWDGKLGSIPLASGVYVYRLEMKGLTGKRISQSGTFVLIR